MTKYFVVLAVLFSFSNCFGDTFTHRATGEKFNGYVVQKTRADKTFVRPDKGAPRYLDLSDYEIRRNYLGRKNRVFIFSIKDLLSLQCETEAFEQAILVAANQGPLFILIELDTPGGRVDLAKRICQAILNIDNCLTVAFVNGSRFSGAFADAAIIALACDKVYIREGTAIGAVPVLLQTSIDIGAAEEDTAQAVDTESVSRWHRYCFEIARLNNRPPLLVKAMLDEDVEVIEIVENGQRLFIDTSRKKPEQTIAATWSEKDLLLTLTAAQAVETGIADKLVASEDELFVAFSAVKAKQIRDRQVPNARREFERAQHRINAILSSITYLEEQATALLEDFDTVDEQFRRANRLTYRGRRYGIGYELDGLLIDRDVLLNRLSAVLNNLVRDYNVALAIAQRNPDLRHHVQTLEKALEKAVTTHREVRFRPLY